MSGLIGKKIGMTQIFNESGKVIPVTVVEAGPCVVVQKKTLDKFEIIRKLETIKTQLNEIKNEL